MIADGSRQSHPDSRDHFVYKLTLSRVALDASACNLPYLYADASSYSISGGRTNAHAENSAGVSDMALPPAGRVLRDGDSRPFFEPRGESPGLDRMGSDPDGLSPDTSPSYGSISDLDRASTRIVNIRTRVANIGICLGYFQNLLKAIDVIFNSPKKNADMAFDSNVGDHLTNHVFLKARNFAINSSGAAIVIPKYPLEYRSLNTETTMSHAYLSTSKINSNGREDDLSVKQNKPRDQLSIKIYIKDLLVEIFSHAYTYITIFAVSIISLFLSYRM